MTVPAWVEGGGELPCVGVYGPDGPGREPVWSDGRGPGLEDGRWTPSARVSWAWDAEAVALHYWRTWTVRSTRGIKGWFGGSRVATLASGSGPRARYVYSLCRWIVDPLSSAESIADAGLEVAAACYSLGLDRPRGSPGSAAVAVLEDVLGKRRSRLRHDVDKLVRLAVYGGRMECYARDDVGPVIQLDRRSAYVAHLLEPLPVGGDGRLTDKPDLRAEGVSVARVSVEPGACVLPVLPCRARLEGEERTVYPWGEWVGAWAHSELRAARDRGYRVKLLRGVHWPRLTRSGSYARFAAMIEDATRRGHPLCKRVGTALVGRLHVGRESRVVVPFSVLPGEGAREVAKRLGIGPGDVIVGGGTGPGRRGPDVAILSRTARCAPAWADPAAAVAILAAARLELLRVIEANADRVVSCATDSVILRGHELARDVDLDEGRFGQWREDFRAHAATVTGPTAYRLEGPAGAVKVRALGIPREQAAAFLRGERAHWQAMLGVMQGKHAGSWVWRQATRDAAKHRGTAKAPGTWPVVQPDADGAPCVVGWA